MTDAPQRAQDIARQLAEALTRPLTHPGSAQLAQLVLGRFAGDDVLPGFADKVLETLGDGRCHDRTAISLAPPRVAVMCVTWSGSHLEVQAERYGTYFGAIAAGAQRLRQAGIELAGFLELDVYVQGGEDGDVDLDVECSFIPGVLLGYPPDRPNPLPNALLLNRDLCTPEELRQIPGGTA